MPSDLDQDAFGTPPSARSSMMTVAGASDEDMEPGEEVLTDEGLLRQFIRGHLEEVIRKTGSGYTLYTKHKKGGKRRRLGSHKSLAAAKRQERAIHAHGG